jgi:NTE family protein
MRVGVVLGAGGVMGGAWLTGALEAIVQTTGWDPGSADIVVGTSAGAMIGGLCAAGVPAWFMVAHSAGEVFEGFLDAEGNHASSADQSAGAIFRVARLPLLIPGSPGLALDTLLRPKGRSWQARVAGWAPQGVISNEPLKQVVRRAVPAGWAKHPNLWIVACDYRTGQRVVFGHEGSPRADLADAIAASCAIPGFYRPVTIGGRRYVDGGMHSTTNLDLVAGQGLDLVVCLNPLSSPASEFAGGWPHQRLMSSWRVAAHRRLERVAAGLRRQGTRVVLIEPTPADLAAMGPNLMSTKRRHGVIEVAVRSVSHQMERHARHFRGLPPSQPVKVRRPDGPPTSWPRFSEVRG